MNKYKEEDCKPKFKTHTGYECYTGYGNKHNFEPIFEKDVSGHYEDKEDKVFTLQKKYICHVCSWCGETINLNEDS